MNRRSLVGGCAVFIALALLAGMTAVTSAPMAIAMASVAVVTFGAGLALLWDPFETPELEIGDQAYLIHHTSKFERTGR